MKGSVLIVDDEATFRDALSRLLERDGYEVETAGTCADGLSAWSRTRPDMVLLDYLLPDGTGLDVLARMRETEKDVPVVVMTAFGSVETAVAAMRAGATDYVAKGADVVTEIRLKVEQARKVSALSEEVDYRRRHGTEEAEPLALLKQSKSLETVVQRIREVARSPETTVLVRGETGAGKELVARAIHDAGLGAAAPLVEVDCASIPENLLESELFGHEKGAFSGADRHKRGLFELAAGGTVLLDEIGEMPERLQSKLLRVLEERHFRRVGGTRNLDLGARVIAMTNRDLARFAREGRFREDLYYRLSVFEIVLPPLRERLEDSLTIADHFVGRFNRKLGKRVPGLSPEARAFLKTYDFPGNVRELRNMIERAMVRAATDDPLPPELIAGLLPPRIDAPPSTTALPAPGLAPAAPAASGTPGAFTFVLGKDRLPEIERTLLNEALSAAGGNKTQAAALLGISRFQLLRKLGREGDADREPTDPAANTPAHPTPIPGKAGGS